MIDSNGAKATAFAALKENEEFFVLFRSKTLSASLSNQPGVC